MCECAIHPCQKNQANFFATGMAVPAACSSVSTKVGAVCNADKSATVTGCVSGQLISVTLPADAAAAPCRLSTELGKIFLAPVAYRMQC